MVKEFVIFAHAWMQVNSQQMCEQWQNIGMLQMIPPQQIKPHDARHSNCPTVENLKTDASRSEATSASLPLCPSGTLEIFKQV